MGVCDEMSGRILRAASPVIRVTAAIALAVTLGLVLLFSFSYGVLAEDSDATPEATAVPPGPPWETATGECSPTPPSTAMPWSRPRPQES